MAAHALPIQPTSFVGREQERAALEELLGTTRLLTLSGVGGVGKTRLALEVAARAAAAFADGSVLVELASVNEPRLVARAVWQSLREALGYDADATKQAWIIPHGQQPAAGPLPSAQTSVGVSGDGRGNAIAVTREQRSPSDAHLSQSTAAAIGTRRILLILDNCEHVAAACADLLSSLLRQCPSLSVLATSREPLRISGEVVWRVPPLSFPQTSETISPEELLSFDAPRLFVARASAALPRLCIGREHTTHIAEICRRLDGIPLALELAAARVSVLALEQLAKRLDDRFRLLTGGQRTSVPHHHTLQAAIDWSFDLLAAPERALFARLSVFSGGWTLEAAEVICGFGGLAAHDVMQLLFQLVDRSMVQCEHQETAARYGMLETLRQYAASRLAAADPLSRETLELRTRHCDWYLSLVERTAPILAGTDEETWLHQLDAELSNVRAAYTWALDSADVERALRFGAASWKYWMIRGQHSEGMRYLNAALELGGEADARLLVSALSAAGVLEWSRGELESAWGYHTRSLELWRAAGDRVGVARALHNLGNVAADGGDYATARAYYLQALALRRELGQTAQIPYTLGNLAVVARYEGAYAESLALEQEHLQLARDIADQWAIAHAFKDLARVHLFMGDLQQAQSNCLESLRLFQRLGASWGAPMSLEVLAVTEAARGNPTRAGRLLGAADAERRRRALLLPPAEREERARLESMARATASPNVFDAARRDGSALSLDEALSYALSEATTTEPAAQQRCGLSNRELDVARLIARGYSNRDIAEALVVTSRTVEAHVSHVLGKLGMRSRAQVAIWAHEHGYA